MVSAMVLLCSGWSLFAETHIDTLRRNFSNLRVGMWSHFGMNTFNGSGEDVANEPLTMYKPTKINPAQWVSAAKQMGAQYYVLTAKHADGFCLWNTATTTYNCCNAGVTDSARKDVVALLVQACHDSGLVPVIYVSVQDRSWNGGALNVVSTDPLGRTGLTNGRLPAATLSYEFNQIKEVVSNYGDVPVVVTDGWAWSMGHTIVPYQAFRDTLYKYSPNTITIELDGLVFPWQGDLPIYENSKGVFPFANNTYASSIINKTGHGNYWFWVKADSGVAVAASTTTFLSMVSRCDSVWCSTAPNVMPNDQGLIQPEYVTWCQQFGAAVASHEKANRPPLPTQPPSMERTITAVNAAASSTGTNVMGTGYPRYAIDGISDGGFADYYTETIWTSGGALPQNITVDLGAVYDSVDMCTCVPVQIARTDTTKRDSLGSITAYQISWSTDDTTFTAVTLTGASNGTWAANTAGKYAVFAPVNARYFRLTATATIGNTKAEISELNFGYDNFANAPRLTGVRPHSSIPIQTGVLKPASRSSLYFSLGRNGLSPAGVTGRSFDYYSIDGKKLFHQEGEVSALPNSAGARAYIVQSH
jgi:alpha-L-fucosidase